MQVGKVTGPLTGPLVSSAHGVEASFLGLSYEGWTALCTALLTVATIALGVCTYLLWRATLKAVGDTAKAIDLAKEANEISERMGVAQVQAYLGCSASCYISGLQTLKIVLNIHNTGETPARSIASTVSSIISVMGGFSIQFDDQIIFSELSGKSSRSVPFDLGILSEEQGLSFYNNAGSINIFIKHAYVDCFGVAREDRSNLHVLKRPSDYFSDPREMIPPPNFVGQM